MANTVPVHQVTRHNSSDRQIADAQNRAPQQQRADEANNPRRQEGSLSGQGASRQVPLGSSPSAQGTPRQLPVGSSPSGQGLPRQTPLGSSPTGQGASRQVPLGSSPSGHGLSRQVPLGSSPSGQGLSRQGSSGQPARRQPERRLVSERASLETPSHSQVTNFSGLVFII